MIRKLVLGAVAAVAIGFAGHAAMAGEPVLIPVGGPGGFVPPHGHRDHDFVVYVRHHGHWEWHGRYETRREAERAERYLESRGLWARIEVVECGRRW